MFDHAKIQNTEGCFAIPRKTGNVPVLFKIRVSGKKLCGSVKSCVGDVGLHFQITEVFCSTVCIYFVFSSNA